MSIIDSGRYRLRKDWASASIPSLVDIDEHVNDEVENSLNITTPLPPPKPPRRSSLALGLFSSKGDKSQKRRSSIAAVFLRRDSNKNSTKDSYESAVKHEKSDGSLSPGSPEISYTSGENIRTSSPNEPGKVTYFDDGSSLRPIVKGINNPYDSPVDKERNRRRRSSLQAKLERHRRKNNDISQLSIDNSLPSGSQSDLTNGSMSGGGSGIGTSSGDLSYGDIDANHSAYFPRQKRHSWWNIFVPEHLKTRSKSRSVDHGLAAPFDLDSLRSKVEGRFESVDRLTNERKKSSLPTIPTKTYTVGNRDTLTSVAARFDTTPSELTHLNRLNSSFIYPGQQLLVPDKSAAKNDSVSGSATGIDEKGSNASISGKSSPVERKLSTTDEQKDENDILEGLRPGSPKPGHIERIDSTKSADSAQAEANKSDDPVITQRFLKINVRHITDGQGVVGGVLLVTPNAVMFDPNVSDPLVIEHGPESYGVIAPMELVVNAAIFHDIAHMRVSGGINTEQNTENAEIYYPQAVLEAKQAKEAKEQTNETEADKAKQGGSVETCDDQESLCSNVGGEREKAEEKGVEAKESVKTDDDGDTASTKANKTDDDTIVNDLKKTLNLTDTRTTLEERRKSLLDHHWAIPSKDRLYYLNSRRSSEDEGDNESQTTIDSGARGQDPHSATSSISGIGAASGGLNLPGGLAPADLEHLEELSKQSCYDSGIDIREPIPNLQPIPKKTVYSDADIVLSSDWVPPKTISPTLMSESPPRSSVLSGKSLDASTSVAGGRKKTSSVSFSVDDNNGEQQAAAAVAATAAATAAQSEKNAEKKNKMLKRLSYPLAWVEGLTGEAGGPPSTGGSLGKSADSESAPNTGDSNQSVFSKVFSRRSSIGTFMRPQSSEGTASTTKLKDVKPQPKLDYRSMVSVDDKPELFISVDKLIPRPARACPDPPLYLRLRMGKPIGKAIPLPTSVMSYGKNKLRPEYWFSVPKNRVDELYRFINTWVQHLYGELNEEQIKTRGFELIQDDTEWTKSGTAKSGRSGSQENEEISDLTRESWELIKAPFAKTYSIIKTAKHAASHEMDLLSGEVLSMSTDDYRKASLFATGSFDLDFPIPDLIGTTEILTEEHREKLCGHLPARAEGYSWSLIFSTSQHGFSLNSLYRKMQKLESPILIVIQDTDNNVFGALTSCSLHVSDHFYGTGESLLYKFNPSFKVFHWTGENLYFIKGNMESLSIGAGDGRFGLWLDGDLNQGRSQSCSTYGNEPLAPQEDFVIKTLECWAFV
ncbi:nuclear receptor coactivator 7 isoform X3 [Ceratitis capitata]|uniref:nuclear receptor coactivator 7 isoform X3 n=1 Tax=Ceratitis capitata TaxID=7213 RepID=UPI000C6C5AC7|nr:nuclear receptor coactivator 7 isoform X3 [Ceratitis capitata]